MRSCTHETISDHCGRHEGTSHIHPHWRGTQCRGIGQARLAIEEIRESLEHELVHNQDFGLLRNTGSTPCYERTFSTPDSGTPVTNCGRRSSPGSKPNITRTRATPPGQTHPADARDHRNGRRPSIGCLHRRRSA
ncbi:hypothetical protein E1202_23150 [Saccharopolyspora karakumensis]|uniref:Type 2A encapsulin shell protein SrpI-like domain-containing protein n=1 Tax=Saccharopolyspora karakumensis TaxID=2530386 RepID=A0A4R5BGK1_9PSEU|nr:hypothetical protein E1202_23150 [Saccharopolyspora karakumensis]